MSSDALNTPAKVGNANDMLSGKRKAANAFWEPFQQFKLLMWMLGATVVVAVLLGAFLYVAFSDLISAVTVEDSARSYYADMIQMQLVHLFRYCAVLFILYVILLAVVCVAYTHRMIGPFQPFQRHVDELVAGNYNSRVILRKNDLKTFDNFADQLNQLAINLDASASASQNKNQDS